MDSTAISLCKDNNLPIIIFNLNERGNIRRVVTRREDRIAGQRVEKIQYQQIDRRLSLSSRFIIHAF